MKIIYVTFLEIQKSINKGLDHWDSHFYYFLFHHMMVLKGRIWKRVWTTSSQLWLVALCGRNLRMRKWSFRRVCSPRKRQLFTWMGKMSKWQHSCPIFTQGNSRSHITLHLGLKQKIESLKNFISTLWTSYLFLKFETYKSCYEALKKNATPNRGICKMESVGGGQAMSAPR